MSTLKQLPLFPEFDESLGRLLADSIDKFAMIQYPLLADIPREPVNHISEPSTCGSGRSSGMTALSMQAENSYDDMLSINLDGWSSFVYCLGKQLGSGISSSLFNLLISVTQETGNVIKIDEEHLSHDDFLNALEMIEFEVDDDMKPIGLKMVVSPQIAEKIRNLPPLTPAQLARQQEILKEKLRKQNEKKRLRKLD